MIDAVEGRAPGNRRRTGAGMVVEFRKRRWRLAIDQNASRGLRRNRRGNDINAIAAESETDRSIPVPLHAIIPDRNVLHEASRLLDRQIGAVTKMGFDEFCDQEVAKFVGMHGIAQRVLNDKPVLFQVVPHADPNVRDLAVKFIAQSLIEVPDRLILSVFRKDIRVSGIAVRWNRCRPTEVAGPQENFRGGPFANPANSRFVAGLTKALRP